LHVVCRLVYLTHFHFCTHIHAVVIICVCQIFLLKELLACCTAVEQSPIPLSYLFYLTYQCRYDTIRYDTIVCI